MAIHFGVIWKLLRIIITLSNYYGNLITVIVTVIIHSNDSHQISNVLNVDERLVNSRPTHVSLLTSLNMIELASLNIVVDRLVHACWNCLFILLLSYQSCMSYHVNRVNINFRSTFTVVWSGFLKPKQSSKISDHARKEPMQLYKNYSG